MLCFFRQLCIDYVLPFSNLSLYYSSHLRSTVQPQVQRTYRSLYPRVPFPFPRVDDSFYVPFVLPTIRVAPLETVNFLDLFVLTRPHNVLMMQALQNLEHH
jgi:hypothetical protein